jgi:predicted AlkP superfamily pyrophosphatase or phosphodiesterase
MNRRCLAAVLLQVVGLVLFSLGFLTSRTEIHVNSSCQPPELLQDIPSQTSGCWGPKIYDRVVVLIVDALRSDFVFPRCTGDGSQPHIHSMPKLSALVQNAVSASLAMRPLPCTSFTLHCTPPCRAHLQLLHALWQTRLQSQ